MVLLDGRLGAAVHLTGDDPRELLGERRHLRFDHVAGLGGEPGVGREQLCSLEDPLGRQRRVRRALVAQRSLSRISICCAS